MQLSKDQSQALSAINRFIASDDSTLALCGPAGTGKTTLIDSLLRQPDNGVIYLTATTHKAASVIANKTRMPASTVHSLFGLQPKPDYTTGKTRLVKKKPADIDPFSTIVIDEASMIDDEMLDLLIDEAEFVDAKLLFVGDPYQLPPVSEGCAHPPVFSRTPLVELKRIHRQAADNPIIAYATDIRKVLDGQRYPKLPKSSDAIRIVDQADFMNAVSDLYNSREYQFDADYCRVLGWTNKTVIAWNKHIRQMLLGPDARKYLFVPGERLVANKPVMFEDRVLIPNEANLTVLSAQPATLYGLGGHFLDVDYEGSVFYKLFAPASHEGVKSRQAALRNKSYGMQREHGKRSEKAVEAWKAFFQFSDRMCDFRSGYASTVHKSQGSTYQHVLIHGDDISRAKDQPGHLLARLMYVAVTRAAQTAVIYDRSAN